MHALNAEIPGRWVNDYRAVARNVTVDFTDANSANFTCTAAPELTTESVAPEDDWHLPELIELNGATVENRGTLTPIHEGALSLDLARDLFSSSDLNVERTGSASC